MEEVKFEDTQNSTLAEAAKELAVSVLGKALEEAKALIEESGCMARLASQDGESQMLAMDFRTDRVNLDVEDGKVVSASVN